MRSLLTRLKRLEHVRAAQRRPQIELQIGSLKRLPPEYTGERHFVTVGRLEGMLWLRRYMSIPEKMNIMAITATRAAL